MVHNKRAMWLILLLSLSVLVMLAAPGISADKSGAKGKLAKTTMDTDMGYFNGNRIWSYLENDGTIVTDDYDGNSGMYWPSRSSLKTINYCSGVWVSGKVNHVAVTACAEYASEWAPGNVLANGEAGNKDDLKYKLYKISKADALDPQSNPDWMNWPVDQGAPWVDSNGNGVYEPLSGDAPALMGDQMIWYVMNDLDANKHSNVFSSLPIGLECKVTVWGYNRPDEFGDMMFAKFQLKNVKSTTVDSTYLGIWADIDLGSAADDFVACDTTLSLGYTYNDGDDGIYGVGCPAIGYDFFQGAIVVSPGDSAKAFGRIIQGYKNLGMAAFIKYINGGGDMYGDPETAQECWNYMSGLARPGTKYTDPASKLEVYPAKYGSGDPVAGTGWLDKLDHPSGDRRQLITCGPFILAPGDSQEVVTACIIGQGSDNLASITQLKSADLKAQTAYDIDFTLPPSPPAPKVKATGLDGAIYLTWDNAAESYEAEDLIDVDADGNPTYYTFQGYNVYQFETSQGVGAVKKLATYDLADLVQDIKDFEFVGSLGENVEHTVQKGTDSNVRRYFQLATDPLRGGIPIVNNRPYYLAVTAYGYNEIGIPKCMESPTVVLTVYPQKPFGQRINATYNDTLAVTHTGPSKGNVTAFITDPGKITGHNYQVKFKTVEGEVQWDVVDATLNKTVLADQTNQSGDGAYNVADGMMVEVTGPVAGLDLSIEGPYGANAAHMGYSVGHGGNRWLSWPTDWGLETMAGSFGNGYSFFGSDLAATDYVDVEIRFAGVDTWPQPDSSSAALMAVSKAQHPDRWSKAVVYLRPSYAVQSKLADVPFVVWDKKNNRQLKVAICEESRPQFGNNNFIWDMGWTGHGWLDVGTTNYGGREYVFILNDAYDEQYTQYLNGTLDGTFNNVMYAGGWGKRSQPYLFGTFELTFYAGVVNGTEDVFSFTTAGKGVASSDEYSKEDIAKINVFPNPYFGYNAEETRVLQHFVRFTHLPPAAKLRIYTLAGELIRTLDHNDGTQFEQWNLENEFSVPVASGIYIVHADCGALGEKVLKAVLVMTEERMRQY